MAAKKIVLIDDDPTLRAAISAFLERLKYQVVSFADAESGIKGLADGADLILSDVKMHGISGYDLLKHVRKNHPQVPMILMTGFGTIEKAVEAMKGGAYDFLVKPFSLSVLETAISAAFLDHQKPARKEESFKFDGGTRVDIRRVSERFITNNSKMKDVIESLRRIAPSKATVLVQGESGTGKELIAKMIHEFSPRAERIFVAINCAAMPDTLLESELFGHEKGSFTGAIARQIGKFELSNNGTILLDEISEMSLSMQTKLLRVLQECEIYRVGGIKPTSLNLRVIATTNRDLYSYMKEGHFREDLYYRLNVIPITLPPLRDRGDDVLLLAQEFLKEFAVLHAREPLVFDDKARRKVKAHPWFGNIRELRNAMERVMLVGNFELLEEGSIAQSASLPMMGDTAGEDLTLADIEKRAILGALNECGDNRTKTALRLGISLRTLRNKLKSYERARREPFKKKARAR